MTDSKNCEEKLEDALKKLEDIQTERELLITSHGEILTSLADKLEEKEKLLKQKDLFSDFSQSMVSNVGLRQDKNNLEIKLKNSETEIIILEDLLEKKKKLIDKKSEKIKNKIEKEKNKN